MPAAGQRTHGTTFWPLKVSSLQVATPRAESAVYDWLVIDAVMMTACTR